MAIALGYYPEWEAESSCVIHKPKELILHRFHFIDYKLSELQFYGLNFEGVVICTRYVDDK